MKYLKLGLIPMVILTALSCEKKVVVDQNSSPDVTATSPSIDVKNSVDKDLPANVLSFLNVNFPNEPVATYEIKNSSIGGSKYEVKLNNGAEIDFDADGNWKQLKDPKGVAKTLIPASITKYVTENYKGVNITSIDKENNKIKIDLSNEIDLEFDNNGTFVRIDK